jgi:hypothetical protein
MKFEPQVAAGAKVQYRLFIDDDAGAIERKGRSVEVENILLDAVGYDLVDRIAELMLFAYE